MACLRHGIRGFRQGFWSLESLWLRSDAVCARLDLPHLDLGLELGKVLEGAWAELVSG